MRVVLYIRVSKAVQNSALQKAELGRYVANHGWQIVEVYEDSISGAKSARPGLIRLLADAAAGKFDACLVWKLDRFGRSLRDCLNNIEALASSKVRFISITQNLDTDESNPASRFLLHILGAAAEFERSLIRERVTAGIQVAKQAGKQLGRPKAIFSRDQVHALRAEGASIREICDKLNLGMGTVARTLKKAA